MATRRYQRQEQLSEVGEQGQHALMSTAFVPPDSLSFDAQTGAQLYACAAGMGVESVSRAPAPEEAPHVPEDLAAHFRHQAASALGLGAAAALAAALRTLNSKSES